VLKRGIIANKIAGQLEGQRWLELEIAALARKDISRKNKREGKFTCNGRKLESRKGEKNRSHLLRVGGGNRVGGAFGLALLKGGGGFFETEEGRRKEKLALLFENVSWTKNFQWWECKGGK